jgi:hypothetical protein
MQEYAIPEDVLTAHLSGEAVILHVGTKRYFQLNATAACIWRGLEQGLGRDQIVDELCERFDVERPDAEEALAGQIAQLCDRELLRAASETGRPSPTGDRGDPEPHPFKGDVT